MEDISHKQIYDRLCQLEEKVDEIDENTKGLVVAFKAAEGAFTVLNWMAQVAKPVIWVVGVAAIIYGAVEHFFKQ
jgi:hypothetical protein